MLSSFLKVRKKTEDLVKNLSYEEMVIQTEDYVSPIKWHLAHTTWFFEYFILKKFEKKYNLYNKEFNFFFNSYYNSMGNFNKKIKRGAHVWPLVSEIFKYREKINYRMNELICKSKCDNKISFLVQLGINHEQQHQELILMDILNIYSHCPTQNVFKQKKKEKSKKQFKSFWENSESIVFEYGASSNEFAYDNEKPKGQKRLNPYKISTNLITNGDWLEFIKNCGYKNPKFWLSDGWDFISRNDIKRPMYWLDNKYEYTLNGIEKININKPVSNISFYEADAFCRFKRKRLPSEHELEFFLQKHKTSGNLLESNNMSAVAFDKSEFDKNTYGNLWCWTSSYYKPYPNYKSFRGNIEEYNQKFMCNQFVLKGGSFATPKNHIRSSYRNFYYPGDRWQFSGLRLAEDI